MQLILTEYRLLWNHKGSEKLSVIGTNKVPAVMCHLRQKDIPEVRILVKTCKHTLRKHTHAPYELSVPKGMHSLLPERPDQPRPAFTLDPNGNKVEAVD